MRQLAATADGESWPRNGDLRILCRPHGRASIVMKNVSYDLIKIGKRGKRLHAVDPDDADGRALCETRSLNRRKYRLQDDAGGYSDLDLWSPVFQTGQRGMPTCPDCIALVEQ
jgi:hypothetical protein